MTDNNTGIIPEFTRNRNGVRIKKCCASCYFQHPFDKDGPRRLCNCGEPRIIRKDDLCGHWWISEFINNIKTKGYGV